jgi:SAM-dependent methyltransferase
MKKNLLLRLARKISRMPYQGYLKIVTKFNPEWRWKMAQKGETTWWRNWLKEHDNDDQWLMTVMQYFNLHNGQEFDKKTVIDIGGGPLGLLTKIKAYTKIVIDPLQIDTDKNLARIRARGENIPLNSGCSDCVFIYNVLQHVVSPLRVLEEGTRILKKGGKFYILEQLNLPSDKLHPHSLKMNMFKNWIDNNHLKILKMTKEEECYFEHPSVPNSDFSILCLIVEKE